MSLSVLLAVLFGALLHASWNISVKLDNDKQRATAGVFIGSAVIAACLLPFLPLPAPAAWPYLAASVVAELFYGVLLAAAYRRGDLSHAYPLMRGTAPLLVALGSVVLIGEHLSSGAWVGVALVSGGILSLIVASRGRAHSTAATRLALLNAVVIACYTLIDGIGVRASGQPIAYTLWLFLLTGAIWLLWWIWTLRGDAWPAMRNQGPRWMVGGACSVGSYGIALWAMTLAPIAAVAAVRESSIVFGTALAAVLLRERVTALRAVAASLVAAGVIVIRLG
jgi:drug/metabolite transporter (DMT)-like permease